MGNLSTPIRDIYADAYRLHERFHGITNDAEQWVSFWKAANEVVTKNNNSPFVQELVTAIMRQLEREVKP